MLPRPLARAVDAALEATVVLSFSRVGYAVRSRIDGWEPLEQLDGSGRRVVVTGANSGLGYATARALLRTGASVVLVVRSDAKGRDTLRALSADLGRDVADRASVELADLADLGSVRELADRLLADEAPIDALVHNAGAMFDERSTTGDGLERTYQIHVVAPFLLTTLLLDRLAPGGRVVTVTSGGMYTEKLVTRRVDSPGGYRPTVAYARAKRAQVALTEEFARRVDDVDFHVMHPGWALTPGVESSLPGFRRLTGPILRDVDQGADTIVWLALADLPGHDGTLWLDRRPRSPYRLPTTRPDPGESDRLWERVSRDADLEVTA